MTMAKIIHTSETGSCAMQGFSSPRKKYGTVSNRDGDHLRLPVPAKGLPFAITHSHYKRGGHEQGVVTEESVVVCTVS